MQSQVVSEYRDPRRTAYVHVPFCRHRCGYCNFTLIADRDDLIERYLKALASELSRLMEPKPVKSLFIGGGTPTHLNEDQLECLLTLVEKWFLMEPNAEFSVEANPEDITPEKAKLLSRHGVNRISLGVQSFDSNKLRSLERRHCSNEVQNAVLICREGIPNISLDLIFGAPHESRATWRRDLETAIGLEPKHISTYGLTIEKGTAFWIRHQKGHLHPADETDSLWMYEYAIDRLEDAGFPQYEVSNFAQRDWNCVHNEHYWLGGEYYAVGPGACSHLNGIRQMNHRSTTSYLNLVLRGKSPIVEEEILDEESKIRELVVFQLRRIEGIDEENFHQEFGINLDDFFGPSISEFISKGFLERANSKLRLTRRGLVVSDSIWPYLL